MSRDALRALRPGEGGALLLLALGVVQSLMLGFGAGRLLNLHTDPLLVGIAACVFGFWAWRTVDEDHAWREYARRQVLADDCQ